MDKLGIFREENSRLQDRFRQFFLCIQIAAIGGILNLIFFGDHLTSSRNTLFFRLDLVALVAGVVITTLLYVRLDRAQHIKTVIALWWLWAVVMALTTWFESGLYSPLILSFPLLFIFAALFAELFVFLCMCGFLLAAVFFMGLNHIYLWLPPPDGMAIEGVPRVISAMVLMSLSGYVCWVFGALLNNSFEDLRLENRRVVESQDVIRQLADCDKLTGLLNRNGAESRYQDLLEKLNTRKEHMVAYFVDLDNFKSINDLFDHDAGDQLLITMGHRLELLLDEDGFACRFGGDEFVLILRVNQTFDIEAFANKIRWSLAQRHTILGTDAEISASVGIAVASDAKATFSSLCKKADMAMYKAKQSGKNQHHVYSDQLQREYMRNLNIVNCLKDAVSDDLLDLYFQPKVNLLTQKVVGVEALLRWNRGNEAEIGPEEFIPVIESTKLIHSIGTWVINEACVACKKWHDAGEHINISVNVSALQLTQSGFYQAVAETLEQSRLPPMFLEIEITEHSLIKEDPLVIKQLGALKALGVLLAIDDFGTGYSNMGYLTRLQIDVLKLDRSFVSEITQSEEHLVVVTAVIKMARVLGMKVVAEGIETKRERDILVGLECDYGQGYLWSRPVPESELLDVIRRFPSAAFTAT